MPSGCLVSASRRTAQPMVPSPPATIIVAFGETSFSTSILGSNSTTRLVENALRSLASTWGVIDPALELNISRLVALLVLTLAARAGRVLVVMRLELLPHRRYPVSRAAYAPEC